MILESLFELLEDLRRRIVTHGQQLRSNEMQTRYALIDPLLRELGWDTSDPSQVTPEYAVGSGRADYALLRSGKPVLMVEAKKLGEDLKGAVLQGVSYAWQQGASHFAVTDGQRWQIYNILSGGGGQEPKPQVSFDVVGNATGAACLEALALWKPSVMDGNVRPGREPVVGLPDEKTASVSDVGQIQPPKPEPAPVGPEWKSLDVSSMMKDAGGRCIRPVKIGFPDGSSVKVKSYVEVTASVANYLWEKGYLTEAKCSLQVAKGNKYVVATSAYHADGKPMTNARSVGPLHVECSYNAQDHVRNVKSVIEQVGQDSLGFKLRFP